MRLIGNKVKLLRDIERVLVERGIRQGTFIDIFSGTANVARHFKRLGYRVVANDQMSMCYSQAVARIEASRYPVFRSLERECADVLRSALFRRTFERWVGLVGPQPPAAKPLARAIHLLSHYIEPRRGLVFRNFCPGGAVGRRYLSDRNGRKVDGILEFLRGNLQNGVLSHEEFHLLLAALIDAVDRVANISGTYGAYLKSWQPNALKSLELDVPEVIESDLRHRAYQEDANSLVKKMRGDVLYIDPPYNRRQYAANYHVLEIIAEYHRIDDLEAYEASLYGKTGLRPYGDLKSDYCVPPGSRAANGGDALVAMTDLVLSSRVRHVVVSYNEEGLLSREEIGAILARFAGKRRFDFDADLEQVICKRFRSDRDRKEGDGKGTRKYKVLEGRRRNEIGEWLFFATRPKRRGTKRVKPKATQPAGLRSNGMT